MEKAIAEVQPEMVPMQGEFVGRAMLTVERIAQSMEDSASYGLADNDGLTPQGEPNAPEGPAACYATLPIRADWIHLPSLLDVAVMDIFLGTPSMSMDTTVGGLNRMLKKSVLDFSCRPAP